MVHTNEFFCLEGEESEYLRSDSIDRSESTDFDACEHLTPGLLNCQKTSKLANHSIKLKIGTTYMLLRNFNQSESSK